jgi:hypothetical protein
MNGHVSVFFSKSKFTLKSNELHLPADLVLDTREQVLDPIIVPHYPDLGLRLSLPFSLGCSSY